MDRSRRLRESLGRFSMIEHTDRIDIDNSGEYSPRVEMVV